MSEKKLIPELRFPGYIENWKIESLQDLTSKIGDGIHSTPEYYDKGEYYFINGNNLLNGKIILSNSTKKVTQEEYNKHKPDLSERTILMSINGTIGNLAFYNNEKVVLGKSAAYISLKIEINKYFIFKSLQTSRIQRIFYSELTGSTIKNLSLKTIRETRIPIPKANEQKKIATFLTSVDQRIHLLQKKKAKLEEYKKGVMQKLFSQEIRFRDGNANDFPEWEEKRLGEAFEIVGGGTPETSKNEYWNGGIPWFTPTEIKNKYINKSLRTISGKGLSASSAKILPINSLLFTSRATIGDCGISRCECTTNQGFQSFLSNEHSDIEFLYYWVKNHYKEFKRKSSGSTFLEISKSGIQKIKINLPSLPEQQKIASFLSSLDQKIEQVGVQLEKMQIWKKGLLQKMFV